MVVGVIYCVVNMLVKKNKESDSHDHVLWSFSNVSIDAKEVGAFESLEPETRKSLT